MSFCLFGALTYQLSDDADSCHYAYPLPFIPVLDTETYELAEIQWTPVFGGESTKTLLDLPEGETYPWELHQSNEYMPHLLQAEGTKLREDVKPYRVSQPEGASFTVQDERRINWQKVGQRW
jgi:primary-amine oxidase